MWRTIFHLRSADCYLRRQSLPAICPCSALCRTRLRHGPRRGCFARAVPARRGGADRLHARVAQFQQQIRPPPEQHNMAIAVKRLCRIFRCPSKKLDFTPVARQLRLSYPGALNVGSHLKREEADMQGGARLGMRIVAGRSAFWSSTSSLAGTTASKSYSLERCAPQRSMWNAAILNVVHELKEAVLKEAVVTWDSVVAKSGRSCGVSSHRPIMPRPDHRTLVAKLLCNILCFPMRLLVCGRTTSNVGTRWTGRRHCGGPFGGWLSWAADIPNRTVRSRIRRPTNQQRPCPFRRTSKTFGITVTATARVARVCSPRCFFCSRYHEADVARWQARA